MPHPTDDLRIRHSYPLIAPAVLFEELPLTAREARVVERGRAAIRAILDGHDRRLLVVVGPCSIHDPAAGLEYARRLAEVAPAYQDSLLLVMRVYFEKPRTTIGWKGLINDPDLDGSYHINKGLHLARELLLQVADLGLPAANEFLDTTFGQYYADLISFGAIGARTVESQVHRELASGLSMPVGFKNRTDGDIQVAVDAMRSARHPHVFPSISKQGTAAILETSGNENGCVILRGGSRSGPNFDAESVSQAKQLMQAGGLQPSILIDCSHGNSNKKPELQLEVVAAVAAQLNQGEQAIHGVMLESHLLGGAQKLQLKNRLVFGQSVTDACLSFADTLPALDRLAAAVQQRPKA